MLIFPFVKIQIALVATSIIVVSMFDQITDRLRPSSALGSRGRSQVVGESNDSLLDGEHKRCSHFSLTAAHCQLENLSHVRARLREQVAVRLWRESRQSRMGFRSASVGN